MLGWWDNQLVDQASDVPSIIFIKSCNKILCKTPFNLFQYFLKHYKIKIKSFECPKSVGNYEKRNAWNVRPSETAYYIVDCRIFGEIYLRRWLGAWWFLIKFHEGVCEMWISWRVLLYCNAFRKSVLVFIYNHLTHLLAWRNSLQAKKKGLRKDVI